MPFLFGGTEQKSNSDTLAPCSDPLSYPVITICPWGKPLRNKAKHSVFCCWYTLSTGASGARQFCREMLSHHMFWIPTSYCGRRDLKQRWAKSDSLESKFQPPVPHPQATQMVNTCNLKTNKQAVHLGRGLAVGKSLAHPRHRNKKLLFPELYFGQKRQFFFIFFPMEGFGDLLRGTKMPLSMGYTLSTTYLEAHLSVISTCAIFPWTYFILFILKSSIEQARLMGFNTVLSKPDNFKIVWASKIILILLSKTSELQIIVFLLLCN